MGRVTPPLNFEGYMKVLELFAGTKTGTQGLNGSKERSVIPAALCEHIVDICEEIV